MIVVYWLIAAAVLAGFEVLTLGLTTIWFAGGAAAAALVCGLGAPVFVQILVFAIVSVILLIVTRPLAVRYLNSKVVKTNIDGLIGKTCVVTEPIENLAARGQVTLNGQTWTARSTNDDILIEEGEVVSVVQVQGVKLIVKKTGGDSL